MNLFNLIGKLVLDTSDYDKGIEEAKEKNKELEENTGKTAVATAGKWAIILAAIMKVANAIKKLVVDSTEYADNIKNLAQIYGYTTREIQEMNSVAEQSGKSLERVLRSIKTSGQTAAEYLGLSAEEYKKMVDEAYEFGTILSDDALDSVDALGDRISYLKSEWQAAVTSLLAGEVDAEEAIDTFFANVQKTVDEYAPRIVSFSVKLLFRVVRALVEMMPQIVGELVESIIDTLYSIDWVEVGVNLIKAILRGVWRGLGKIGKKIFGIDDGDEESMDEGASFLQPTTIGAGDYETRENITQRIDVNLKYEGDTPVSAANAEIVGSALAQQIDEILGRRLNG